MIREFLAISTIGIRSLGIQKEDRVALLLPNSPQFVIAYYGLLKAGVTIVPLNPLYTARELHEEEIRTAVDEARVSQKIDP
jgi:acyl-CoA synthetase (AMP-forming)/AMP-acid ligase II